MGQLHSGKPCLASSILLSHSNPLLNPQGYFGATNTTQRRVTASKLITETPAVPGWDKHLEWDHSCIHHLVLSSPEDISLPTPPFLSWMCTASPSSGTGGDSELQSRMGTAEAAFTTKAFLVKLPTVCSITPTNWRQGERSPAQETLQQHLPSAQ